MMNDESWVLKFQVSTLALGVKAKARSSQAKLLLPYFQILYSINFQEFVGNGGRWIPE
jgi:hypothetical protein